MRHCCKKPFDIDKDTNLPDRCEAIAHSLIPKGYDETNVSHKNWQALKGQELKFKELSVIVFSDAVDSIARVWLRVWRKYMKWEMRQRRKG